MRETKAAAASSVSVEILSDATLRQLAPPSLALDAPPSSIDEDYLSGRLAIPRCPRGCAFVGYVFFRKVHYKEHHYNVFYALENDPSLTAVDRWMNVQFGDRATGARTCLRCVSDQREQHNFRQRFALAHHIRWAHPTEFIAMAHEYSRICEGRTPDSIHWQLLGVIDGSNETATTSAMEDEPLLALNAPPSSLDKEYWSGSPANGCPRGCRYNTRSIKGRMEHYKKCHYNVYYSLADLSLTSIERWLYVQFGDFFSADRQCVRCIDNNQRSAMTYRGRTALAKHIQSAHPVEYSDLVREYCSMPNPVVPDDDLHRILMASATKFVATSSTSATSPKTWQTNAATTVLALDALPSEVDFDYWTMKPSIAECGGSSGCPRGCVIFVDTDKSRRVHYKRHHYNVYYDLVKMPVWTTLDRWIHVNFGEAREDARVCVRCDGDRRKFTFYRNRIELASHIQSDHPTELAELTCEYCLLVTGSGEKIVDDGVHAILLNTPMVPQ